MKQILLKLIGIFLVTCYPNLASANVTANASIQSMNIEELEAIEKEGKIVFMSSNGRYLIQGIATDIWSKKKLTTIDDIKYAESHIDINAIGLDVDKLNTITFGNGKSTVIAYVDPRCPFSKRFVEAAKAYTNKYTFKLVVIPALGEVSQKHAKSLFCAQDRSKSLDLFLEGKLDEMPQKKNCDMQKYDLMLMSAKMFRIKTVPWFIASDGRYKSISPESVWQWLDDK